jgi:hypothetical protein
VATFEGTDVEWMRNEMKQNPPQSMPEGLRGGLSLVDAGGGRQLFISLFDTREQIEAGGPTFERGTRFPRTSGVVVCRRSTTKSRSASYSWPDFP